MWGSGREIQRERVRILLLADLTCWILGTIAQQIQCSLPDRFETRTLSVSYLKEYPRLVDESVAWADVVHCLDVHVPASYYRAFRRKAFVCTVHHVDGEPPADHVLSHIRSQGPPDCLVTVCAEVADTLMRQGIDKDILFVVPNGVDTSVFRPPTPRQRKAARRRLGIGDRQFAVGFFAKFNRMNDRKGADTLLQALAHLLREGRQVFLLSTGLKPVEFRQAVRRIGLPNRCDAFVFRYEDMLSHYWALDAYLITARNEGGPVTLLEAMASSVPVVSTPVGMVRDYGIDGVNALVAPIDDVESIAGAVSDLMDNPQRAARLSQAGLQTANRELQWSTVLSGLPRVYDAARAGFKRRTSACVEPSHVAWSGPSLGDVQAFDLEVWERMLLKIGQVPAARRVALAAFRRWPRSYRSRAMVRAAFEGNRFLNACFAARDWLRGLR